MRNSADTCVCPFFRCLGWSVSCKAANIPHSEGPIPSTNSSLSKGLSWATSLWMLRSTPSEKKNSSIQNMLRWWCVVLSLLWAISHGSQFLINNVNEILRHDFASRWARLYTLTVFFRSLPIQDVKKWHCDGFCAFDLNFPAPAKVELMYGLTSGCRTYVLNKTIQTYDVVCRNASRTRSCSFAGFLS